MAEKPGPSPAADPTAASTSTGSWSDVWQLPTLLLALGLLLIGLWMYTAQHKPAPFDVRQGLDDVVASLRINQYEQAHAQLEEVRRHLSLDTPMQQRARYYLVQGDLVYEQQHAHRWDNPADHRKVLAAYQQARDMGLVFDDRRLLRWAETHAALGEDDRALARLDELSPAGADRRHEIIRRIIERRLVRQRQNSIEQLAPLLSRFEQELARVADRVVRRDQEVWAVALRARLLLTQDADGRGDEPHQVIRRLPRELIRLTNLYGDEALAPVKVPLAEAFARVGRFDDAEHWFRIAAQDIAADPTDALHPRILVGLGRIALVRDDDPREALRLFDRAHREYPGTAARLDAAIGVGDVHARLGAHAEAREVLALTVAALRRGAQHAPDREADRQRHELRQVILVHHDREAAEGQYARAIDYLLVLGPLYEGDWPMDLLARLATAHRQLARRNVDEARTLMAEATGADGRRTAAARADWIGQYRMLNQDAAIHYQQAGDYFYQYALRANAAGDEQAFADTLWASAQCYDHAQLWDRAIERYADYTQHRPEDPRRHRARLHLALAYQASGRFDAALQHFTLLIDDPETRTSPEAYDALVPMAQCFLAVGDVDAARRTLLTVVEDHPAITPESAQYRDALTELGRLHHRAGQFNLAIERFTQAMDLYGRVSGDEAAAMRFALADSYRQSARELSQRLEEAVSQTQLVQRRAERQRRLEEAMKLFDQVITQLDQHPTELLSDLQRLYLRNAFFYRADCAYDLGRYRQAIELYDLAASRYAQDPASLVALVQIVNAYSAQGLVAQARAANRRAYEHFSRIPDEAFDDPNLPMDGRHWDQWLRWTNELNLHDAADRAQANHS
jgi:tetratricopeptide (TPR) repeat protein